MLIDDCEIRKFFESHCDAKLRNEWLDTLKFMKILDY